MATTEELLFSHKKFMFRGKVYKFAAYIPIPSIEMIADDGTMFSFGENSPISKEFVLLTPNSILNPLA